MISIVIPTYNVAKFIGGAVESILRQTYSDWELIIVDDCSTDNTVAVIESYREKCDKIRLIRRNANSGGARKPRYDGILAATGDWVTHIDSDDFIEDEYLEKLLARKEETGADLVLSKLQYCGTNGEPDKRQIPSKIFDFDRILTGVDACNLTIDTWQLNLAGLLIDTKRYQSFVSEVYNEDCNSCFNDELDYRKLLLSVSSVAVCDATYYYRQHAMSVVHLSVSQYIDRLNQIIPLHTFLSGRIQDDAILQKLNASYIQSLYVAESTYLQQRKSLDRDLKQKAQSNIRRAHSFMKEKGIRGKGLKQNLISRSFVMLWAIASLRNIVAKIKNKSV